MPASMAGTSRKYRQLYPASKPLSRSGIDPVGLALFESSSLTANPYVKSLDELRTRFPFSP
jgi:hypothetical protein